MGLNVERSMKRMDHLLEMHNIKKSFSGIPVLHGIDLDILPGEVHALLGENGAGKSTLIKILTGAHAKDSGEIIWKNQKVNISEPKDAFELGISAIYQELNLVPQLSIAENLFLGRENLNGYLFNNRSMEEQTNELLKEFKQSFNPRTKVGSLGIGQQQIVEIMKSVSRNARLIIMDEPTSSLSNGEVRQLFDIVRSLKSKGVSMIFITHRIEEIQELADRVTIMRDGESIKTLDVKTTDVDTMIHLMVGRELKEQFPKIKTRRGQPALEVKNICSQKVKNITFTAYRGEILGFAGLVGAGRTELAHALFGSDPVTKGEIYIDGNKVTLKTPLAAIKNRIAFVTEDRKKEGLILDQSIQSNVSIASLGQFTAHGLIDWKAVSKKTREMAEMLKIRPPEVKRPARTLSGGNQQKVVIAKWLTTDAEIYIFDEPTRGIDVGAKVEVYQIMNKLIEEGRCVIMISSELPEVIGMSDRVLVMYEGKITGEFTSDSVTQEAIMAAAAGEVEKR